MPEKSSNVTWHSGAIDRAAREKLAGHRGAVLWFTGLSGSGKSTLAHAVEAALHARACRTYVLDGDNIRHGLNGNLAFSAEDRKENIRRIGEVAKLFQDAGVLTLTAFISPFRADREAARGIIGDGFIEVYVKASLEACEARDPKGLYVKARAGEIKDFTGVHQDYEQPDDPELVVDTESMTLEHEVAAVLDYLEARGIIPANAK
jgi:adenylylsulfate kinase